MHLETVLHTDVYHARPDVGAVVHGHPPYATALGATEASLELLTHDAVLFADGLPVFEDSPDLVLDADQGAAVARGARPHRAVLLRNHGVLVVGKDVPWATLSAATLERAVRLQSIAATFGALRPIPRRGRAGHAADKYRDQFVEEYWEAWLRKLVASAPRADAGVNSSCVSTARRSCATCRPRSCCSTSCATAST